MGVMSADTHIPLLEYTRWAKKLSKIKDRIVKWDHILQDVPLEKKIWAGQVVLENFDLFEDDYPVVVCTDSGEYLRFHPVIYHRTILNRIDLNLVAMDVQLGKFPLEHYNALLRDKGLSLSGYRDMRQKKDDMF
jgi:hypothetical protein